MIARCRYDDPVHQVWLSEDRDCFYLRVAIPRTAVTSHLEVLETVLRGLDALLLVYADPLPEPEPFIEPERV